jgi:hypothetical protein
MKWRHLSACIAGMSLFFSVLSGCRKEVTQPWEVVVQNKSTSWCEVQVVTDPLLGANAMDLAPQEQRILGSGKQNLIVRSVSAICYKKKRTISPEADVRAGRRCLILIEADGQVRANVSDI